jgi:hypothetical protein
MLRASCPSSAMNAVLVRATDPRTGDNPSRVAASSTDGKPHPR